MGLLSLVCYEGNSTTARLSELLSCDVVTDRFDAENGLLLRWGASFSVKNVKASLNSPKAIRRTKNKLEMLQTLRLREVRVPNETKELPCVARQETGSRGEGISFCKTERERERASDEGAKVFLEWIPIRKEYRVHIFRGRVLGISEKKKGRNAHPLIRGVSNGWVFRDHSRLDAVDAVSLISTSLAAVEALRLDFGAVDIALTKNNEAVVFEVNTAPGLNGAKAIVYADAILKWASSVE